MMKKPICIVLSVVMGLIAVGAAYWNFRVHQEKSKLKETAEVYQKACNSQSGCIKIPAGWDRDFDGSYFQGRMSYISQDDRFMLSNHIATDVFIVATGGKNIPLTVIRKVE